MKIALASILIVSVISLSLTSCDVFGGGTGGGKKPTETTETSESVEISYSLPYGKPSHDLNSVDAKETFEDLYIDPIDTPWGSTQNLRMVSSDVDNFFVYYSLDRNDNQINENLNFISTVTKPSVRAYASEDEPGYIIYEVSYDQVFPIHSREPSSVYTSFFSYHNVEFVDYYTGRKFPAINLSTQIDSFGVTGNVFYKGEKYKLGYYEFRSQEPVSSSTEDAGGGYVFRRQVVKLHSTAYFIVPEFYRGILMCVYIANATNTPLADIMNDNTPYFRPPTFFGDEENPDDYVFFGISAPQ